MIVAPFLVCCHVLFLVFFFLVSLVRGCVTEIKTVPTALMKKQPFARTILAIRTFLLVRSRAGAYQRLGNVIQVCAKILLFIQNTDLLTFVFKFYIRVRSRLRPWRYFRRARWMYQPKVRSGGIYLVCVLNLSGIILECLYNFLHFSISANENCIPNDFVCDRDDDWYE